ncbi:MAG: NUDIX domain-containing protein [Halodesulfurarchaeum sp.]
MDERAVLTVFLTNRGETLLLRRSDEVGSYPGRWGAVAGHVEKTPIDSARQEIREETGLDPELVTLINEGEPFTVTDGALEIRWTVHPFRFVTPTRDVTPNWETADLAWVPPPEIRERETVPELWTSWDRVRPTVESVVGDEKHGSATISCRALEVLRDEATILAAEGGEWAELVRIATALREAREAMAVVRTRIDRVMDRAGDERTLPAVRETATRELERAFEADRAAAGRAAETIEGKTVFTLSRSGTVEAALDRAEPAEVRVAVSRPGGEGEELAITLADRGHDVALYGDANVPRAIDGADVVLVGADSVLANGDVINKAGTTAAALVASHLDVPMIVAAARDKISPDAEWSEEADGGITVSSAEPEQLRRVDPPFERTPAELLDALITEQGRQPSADIERVAARHADLGGWMDNR